MSISPTSTDTPLAAIAGVAPVIVGRAVSRVKTSTVSKTAMILLLPSIAPATRTVALPEGMAVSMVSWPLQVAPVNCNCSKAKVCSPMMASTVGAVPLSMPECSSSKPMARVAVWPMPSSVRLRVKEETSGATVSMIKLCVELHAEREKPSSTACTDQK